MTSPRTQDQASSVLHARLYDLLYQGFQEADQAFLDHLLGILKQNCRGQRILDCACGTGFPGLYLAQQFDITLSDRSAGMLTRLREKTHSLPRQPRQILLLDWKNLAATLNKEFDAIICTGNSFPMCLTPEARLDALRSMRQVLKEGGLLYLDFQLTDQSASARPEQTQTSTLLEPRLGLPATLVVILETLGENLLTRVKRFYALHDAEPRLYAEIKTVYSYTNRTELTEQLRAAGFSVPTFALRPGAWSMPCLLAFGI